MEIDDLEGNLQFREITNPASLTSVTSKLVADAAKEGMGTEDEFVACVSFVIYEDRSDVVITTKDGYSSLFAIQAAESLLHEVVIDVMKGERQ